MEAIAAFAVTVPGIRQVNLLPYHKSGIQKFRRLGLSYVLDDLPGPSAAAMADALAAFRAVGIPAKAGG